MKTLAKHYLSRRAYSDAKMVYAIAKSALILVIRLAYAVIFRLSHRRPYLPRIGMHTVFIARENVLFMEEWILYHKSLGVEHFFLYDNSKVEIVPESHADAGAVAGAVAKRNVPYARIVTMTDAEIQDELDRLCRDIPNVHVIPWSPVNDEGKIWHGKIPCQEMARQAHRDVVDWMLFMDMDEYLVIGGEALPEMCTGMARGGYGGGAFLEHPMDHRYKHLDKMVCEIDLECPYYIHLDQKILCHLPMTIYTETHRFRSRTAKKHFNDRDIHYRHYKHHGTDVSNLIKLQPLSPRLGRHPDWKMVHAHPDWRQIMEETKIDDSLTNFTD